MSGELQAKTILVTGAARGIGAALCDQLVAAGANVIALDREPVAGVQSLIVDLRDSDAITECVVALPTNIDAVAFVAGVPGTHAPDAVMQVNFLAVRALLRGCIAKMASGGAAVFVSSVSAHRCTWSDAELEALCIASDDRALAMLAAHAADGVASYELSKRALNYWVLSRIHEFSRRQLRATIVSPGPVQTGILGDFEESMGKSRIDAAADIAGRHAHPGEVAAAICFLLSDAASWVNGIELKVDGGFHALRAAGPVGAAPAL